MRIYGGIIDVWITWRHYLEGVFVNCAQNTCDANTFVCFALLCLSPAIASL